MRIAGTIDAKEELKKARIEIYRQEEKKKRERLSAINAQKVRRRTKKRRNV